MSQAALYNDGCSLGLLCGADTRMASFFYSMHRCLRQRRALLATIHSSLWESVELNQRIRKAIRDIENDDFWKALYFILRCVWPALRALRLGDSNKPGMHMIYYLSHLTSVHINKSAAEFKNSSEALFLSEMDDDDSDLSCGDLDDKEQEEL